MTPNIKIKFKNLKGKSEKELLEMKKQMEFHLTSARSSKGIGQKGFNIIQERKNIARINTLLKQKENEKIQTN